MNSSMETESSRAAPIVLLLTKPLQAMPSGGREKLCKLNHDVLADIYGERLVVFELPPSDRQRAGSVVRAFRGHIDGLDRAVIATALGTIQARNVGKVFVDGSNLGAFVEAVKQRYPEVEVSTFFHNVEARFFLGALRRSRKLRALAVLTANYLAERKSVRYSDKIICLSDRDSRLLLKLYGRGATHVAPMALQDTLPNGISRLGRTRGKFALFVGGVFYANRAGVAWFVDNVVPRIDIETCIVGKGFEGFRQALERSGKVEVVGAVDDLTQWYQDAHFVIAPIFDGSGMKTKVAEALMHGKKVIGTPEAFSGYEDVAARAGWVCATADDFVAAIGQACETIEEPFDSALRVLYDEKYSYAAARSRRADILGSVQ